MLQNLRARTVTAAVATALLLMLFSSSAGMGFNVSALGAFLSGTVFWVAVVGGGVWLAVEYFGVLNKRKLSSSDDAVSTVRQRYARGEISRAEYFQIMQDLQNDTD